MNEVLTRKPAPIVKCQHCKWVGSARGLFTHVRMAHPGINEKPPTITREHPYIANPTSKSITNQLPLFKAKKYAPLTKREKEDFVLWAALVPALVYMFNDPDIKDILTREGVNPKRLITALGRI